MKSWLFPFVAVLGLQAQAQALEVHSADMKQGKTLTQAQVFKGFGCEGQNISPEVRWSGAPAKTRSFAVTLFDPDAPTGSGWWHWTVVNIPATANHLPTGAGVENATQLPAGAVQGRTDFGNAAFGGACPPPGAKPHRYQLTVWALDTDQLPIDANASGALVGFMLNAHVLAKAQLTARYGR